MEKQQAEEVSESEKEIRFSQDSQGVLSERPFFIPANRL
jgi:hypothetical protein